MGYRPLFYPQDQFLRLEFKCADPFAFLNLPAVGRLLSLLSRPNGWVVIVELLIQLLSEILVSLFVCLFSRPVDTEVAEWGLHMEELAVGRIGEDVNSFSVDRTNRRCRGFRFQYGVCEMYSPRN